METVEYSNSIVLKVTAVDNQLTAYLNPDIPNGQKMAEVYRRYVSGFSSPVNDTIDLTQTLAGLGGSATFAAIASNFVGGGAIAFELVADGSTVYKQNTSLAEYTSQQWAVAIKKR